MDTVGVLFWTHLAYWVIGFMAITEIIRTRKAIRTLIKKAER